MATDYYYPVEPPHSDLLKVQSDRPFNAEAPVASLVEFNITPEDLVYCRNHGPVREFDEATYTITIKGGVNKDLEYTIAKLKASFPTVQVVAALQVRWCLACQGRLWRLKTRIFQVCRKPTE